MALQDLLEQPSSKKQKIIYIIIAALIIIPITILSISVVKSKSYVVEQLVELNKNREQAFTEIRPALMQYKEQHKVFPETLDKLVPDYITTIPKVLLIPKPDTTEYDSLDMSIKYSPSGDSAYFSYRRGYIHTPKVTYDVVSDSYTEHNDAEATTE
ncbi:MAG: hypothetical protein OEZ38_08595 [Gammaproteobacteria bacterium]|nr:hypothetical protein [Gammaproteobacteria bacterium]